MIKVAYSKAKEGGGLPRGCGEERRRKSEEKREITGVGDHEKSQVEVEEGKVGEVGDGVDSRLKGD